MYKIRKIDLSGLENNSKAASTQRRRNKNAALFLLFC